MGSAAIPVTDEHLHVGVDAVGIWWAVGREGSYGGGETRLEAIRIAADASATAYAGERRIVVHREDGRVAYRIVRLRVRPSSQFFQDAGDDDAV